LPKTSNILIAVNGTFEIGCAEKLPFLFSALEKKAEMGLFSSGSEAQLGGKLPFLG
jgi:hypothetical protein